MKTRGFTLIELLAVIVILAIIALIVTPIILGLINESRKQGNARSAEIYIDAVRQAVARKNMTTRILNATCIVNSDGNLDCDGTDVLVDVANTKAKGGTIMLEKGVVVGVENLDVDGNIYNMNKNGKLVLVDNRPSCIRKTDNNGFTTITCKTEKFYVLNENSTTVTMLSAKNITLADTPIQSDNAGTLSFADTKYWDGDEKNIYNSNSNLYKYVEAYKNTLKNIGVTVKDARLLNYDEISNMPKYYGDVNDENFSFMLQYVNNNISDEQTSVYDERVASATEQELEYLAKLQKLILNFDSLTELEQKKIIMFIVGNNVTPQQLYNWQFNPPYWCGSKYSGEDIYAIANKGDFIDGWDFMQYETYDDSDTYGIRPVIEMPLSNIR